MTRMLGWLSLWFMAGVLEIVGADNLKAFPLPEKGVTRYVLELPARKDESAVQVELVVGRVTRVDAVNRYFYGGRIEVETIRGWGFPKYTVRDLGPLAGTLMAPDPTKPAVERFVSLGGEPYLIRYNSRLPVVVYVPEGAEVRYRLWKADGKPKPMPAK